MRPRKVFTVRRVARPLSDLRTRISSPVNVKGSITDNAIRFVKCNDFTFHLPPVPLSPLRRRRNSQDSSHIRRRVRLPKHHTPGSRTRRFVSQRDAGTSLPPVFLEPAETGLLLRVHQMDHPHGELREAVSSSQRPAKR